MDNFMEEGWIDVRGGQIWYVKAGGDPEKCPLVGLHGGPGFTHDYLEVLLDLAPDRTVVLYDQLGGGRSKPATPDASLWTLDRFVEELEALRAFLGFERMHLLGHSWGGSLAASYATSFPDRVCGLFLASPLINTARWLEACKARLAELPPPWPQVIAQREAERNFGAPDYQAATFEFYRRHFCRVVPWPDPLVRSFQGMNPEVYETMWGPTEFSCTGNLSDFSIEDMRGFSGPIQLSCGRYDEASEDYLQELSTRWTTAELHVFPESSHSVSLEEPAAFLQKVNDFFLKADRQCFGPDSVHELGEVFRGGA